MKSVLRSKLKRWVPRSFAARVIGLVWLGGLLPVLIVLAILSVRGRLDAVESVHQRLKVQGETVVSRTESRLSTHLGIMETTAVDLRSVQPDKSGPYLRRLLFRHPNCLGVVLVSGDDHRPLVSAGVRPDLIPPSVGTWWIDERRIIHRVPAYGNGGADMVGIWEFTNELDSFGVESYAGPIKSFLVDEFADAPLTGIAPSGYKGALGFGSGGHFKDLEGEEWFVKLTNTQIRKLGPQGVSPVSVVCVMPVSVGLESLRESLGVYGGISLLALLVTGIAAWWISQFIARPILELGAVASSVQEGNLSVRAPENGPTEVLSLAASFNDMVVEVQRYRNKLQQEVDWRTRSLADSRVRLELLTVRLRSIYDAMEEGLLVTDPDGRITEVNRKFLEMFPPSEKDSWLGTHVELFWKHGVETLGGEDSLNRELDAYRMQKKSKGWLDWQATLVQASFRIYTAPVMDPEGGVICRLWLFEDQTEKRELEETFQRTQKMDAVGRMAGGLAHDFNNMLTVISGYAEMLMTSTEGQTDVQNDIGEIQKTTKSAMAMTERLLAIGHRQKDTQTSNLNAAGVVEQMKSLLEQSVGNQVELSLTISCDQAVISMNESQLEQIVLNLCINARDAMDAKGRIHVRTRRVHLDPAFCSRSPTLEPGTYWQLTVEDNGSGIPQEVLDHIFEPFFTTKETGKGTGLGLASVYGIVRQHNGYIDVRSRAGQGTAFHVFFPVSQEELSVEAAQSKKMPKGNASILIVDDEAPVRNLLKRQLGALGYEIESANTGQEALDRLTQGSVGLLVTDLLMPEMSGGELATHVWAIHPQQRVLFVSGFTNEQLPENPNGPAPVYLAKPFSMGEIARTVYSCLQESSDGGEILDFQAGGV